MEKFERHGYWWRPEDPKTQIAGVLTFDPMTGTRLTLIGDLFNGESKIGIIIGNTNELYGNVTLYNVTPANTNTDLTDERVTLYNLTVTHETYNSSYRGATYYVEAVFTGRHFATKQALLFSELYLRFTNIEEWFNTSSFSGDVQTNPDTLEVIGANIVYQTPKAETYSLDSFTISFVSALSGMDNPLSLRFVWGEWKDFWKIGLKQITVIKMVFNTPTLFDDIRTNVIPDLTNLLSLGVGSDIYSLGLHATAWVSTYDDNDGKVDKESEFDAVNIYYTSKNKSSESADIESRNMFFRYSDVKPFFQNFLQQWFDTAARMRPVFDLFFGIYYPESVPTYFAFLTMAQAIEAYHRRKSNGQFISVEEYSPVLNEIVTHIPADLSNDHKNRLSGLLKYGYEYSLRRRLKDILEEIKASYPDVLEKLFGDPKQVKQFIGEVVDTRNYLTHYNATDDNSRFADSKSQLVLFWKLRSLLQLLFYHDLGFPTDLVTELAARNRRLRSTLW